MFFMSPAPSGWIPQPVLPPCTRCTSKDQELSQLKKEVSQIKQALVDKEEVTGLGGPAVRKLLQEVQKLRKEVSSEGQEFRRLRSEVHESRSKLASARKGLEKIDEELQSTRDTQGRKGGNRASAFACPLIAYTERFLGRNTCLLPPRHDEANCAACKRNLDLRDMPMLI